LSNAVAAVTRTGDWKVAPTGRLESLPYIQHLFSSVSIRVNPWLKLIKTDLPSP
jgi:hypothetical protein